MSSINTGNIDATFPIPGINQSSQGFRTNFTAIKNNLNLAKTELDDLQQKGIFKSALTGTTLNNDMSNALISNALVRGFRSTTYNLGDSLTGNITVDVTKGDVQYGTIKGNVYINFSKWAPAGTQSNVQLILTDETGLSHVLLPQNVNDSKKTLINWSDSTQTVTLAREQPYLHYVFSTIDCGTTVEVEPLGIGRATTNIINKTPSLVGEPGDRRGAVAINGVTLWICTEDYDGFTEIWQTIPGGGTVTSVKVQSASDGIEVQGNEVKSSGTFYIKNTGVVGVTSDLGIQVTSTGGGGNGEVTIKNTGVVSLVSADSNKISVSSNATTGVYTVGLAANVSTGTVTNVELTAGNGISVSGSPITSSGNYKITNTGVLSLIAGTGINVSSSTGNITISLSNAITGGNTGITTITAVPGSNNQGFYLDANTSGTNANIKIIGPDVDTLRYNLGIGTVANISLNNSTSQYLRGDGTWASIPTSTTTTTSGVTQVAGTGSGLGFSLSGTVTSTGSLTLTTPSAEQLRGSLSLGNIATINRDGSTRSVLLGNGQFSNLPYGLVGANINEVEIESSNVRANTGFVISQNNTSTRTSYTRLSQGNLTFSGSNAIIKVSNDGNTSTGNGTLNIHAANLIFTSYDSNTSSSNISIIARHSSGSSALINFNDAILIAPDGWNNLGIAGGIIPKANATQYLGNSNYRWGNVYSVNINSNNITSDNITSNVILKTEQTVTATTAGTKGEIRFDSNYLYICTATNTWKRVALSAIT